MVLIFLFNQKFKKRSNLFLALTILAVSLSNFKIALIDIGATAEFPLLQYLPIIWPFLIPVSLYFFVQHLTHIKFKPNSFERLLFMPFLINFGFQITFFIQKLLFPISTLKWVPKFNQFKEYFAIVFCLGILLIIIRNLKTYDIKLKANYANLTGKSLAWLNNLIIAILVLWLFWVLPYSYIQWRCLPNNQLLYPFWLGITILIYWIGYSTFSRDDIFSPAIFKDAEKEHILKPSTEDEAKEQKQAIESDEEEEKQPKKDNQFDVHYARLQQLMEKERLYENPNLDMSLLAEKMQLSNGYLSQIINQKEGKNFFNYINGLRVNAVIDKLKNPEFDHYSILGIAMECGFSSKSTFNAAFKKITGKTPSSYRKR